MLKIIALGGLLWLCAPFAWAGREIFTETPSVFNNTFNALEPASGPAAPAAPANDGHAPPTKSGGKDLHGPIALPEVKIGQTRVQRHTEAVANAENQALPSALQGQTFPHLLNKRFGFTPFAHTPQQGASGANITVVIFEDLSCLSCTTTSQKITTDLAAFTSSNHTSATLQVLWVHSPSTRWQSSNLPAFYGKVAARQGKFWEYRTALLATPERTPESTFGVLTALGLEARTTRQLMLAEARRFYRELDGDTQQAKSLGVAGTPTVLINGIRVGPLGVPLELLPEVLNYVKNRWVAGLDEPLL